MDKKKTQLPSYIPNKKVWQDINNELNQMVLNEKLNQYNPDKGLWTKINTELDKSRLDSLPQYEPSIKLWDNIARNSVKSAFIVGSHWLRIAAILLIAIGVGYSTYWGFSSNKNIDDRAISYSEVWVEPTNVESWELEEDENINQLLNEKESEFPSLLRSVEYRSLKRQYVELVDSKKEILSHLDPYDEDADLELILTRIEIEKNSLVRSLILFTT